MDGRKKGPLLLFVDCYGVIISYAVGNGDADSKVEIVVVVVVVTVVVVVLVVSMLPSNAGWSSTNPVWS